MGAATNTTTGRAAQIAADCARIGRERAAENGDDLSSRTDEERTLRRELCASRIESANLRGHVHALCAELEPATKPHRLYSFSSTLAGQEVTVDYEPTDDGACLGNCYAGPFVFDAHEDAGVFAKDVTARWQIEADKHLKAMGQDARDDGALVLPFGAWVDTVDAALAAEDAFIRQRDHVHYARAA